MKFLDALLVARDTASSFVRVSRPNGPSLRLDDLGGLVLEENCLYLGDIFDLEDWQIEELEGEHYPRMIDTP